MNELSDAMKSAVEAVVATAPPMSQEQIRLVARLLNLHPAPDFEATAQAPSIQCEALAEYDGLVAVQMYDPGGRGIYAPPSTALPCPNAAMWEAILPSAVLICDAHDLRGCQDCDLRARKLLFCGRCLAAFAADDLGLMTFRRL